MFCSVQRHQKSLLDVNLGLTTPSTATITSNLTAKDINTSDTTPLQSSKQIQVSGDRLPTAIGCQMHQHGLARVSHLALACQESAGPV
jgi:hypothetical protein